MTRSAYILGCCFLLSSFASLSVATPAQAQAGAPQLELSADLSASAPAAPHTPSRGALWGATLGGGLLAAGAVVGVTHVGIWAAAHRCDGRPGDLSNVLDCTNSAVLAYITMNALAYPAAIAGGVTLGGHLAGGQGRYDMTLLGSTVGSGLGWVFMAAMARADSEAGFVAAMAALPLLQLAGSLAGYHLSHRVRSRRGLELGPTLAPSRDGAVVGLVGRF